MQSDDGEPKIEIMGTEETCLTFVIRDEDHTMGNLLRYILIKNPDVRFCGYSIPHPSENILKLRLETNGKPAAELFQKAVMDLHSMMQHMKGEFKEEVMKSGHDAEAYS